MKQKIQGTLSILFATVIWGSAFIAQSVGMDHIGPFTFQTLRCGVGVPFLFILTWLFENNKTQFLPGWKDRQLWKAGIACGIALFAAAGLQQVGLVYTDAGKAGFLTALYIVLVPVLGLFLGSKPPVAVWFSVILAVAGLYFLCCTNASGINIGDICLIGCALAFAVQITLIDRMGKNLDGLRLNCIQTLVCAILSGAVMLITEEVDLHGIGNCAVSIAYAGILSTGVAYSLQIIGQQRLDPTPASLLMSLESVVAVVCGCLILHESLSFWEITGCILMFAAVILSQLPQKKK